MTRQCPLICCVFIKGYYESSPIAHTFLLNLKLPAINIYINRMKAPNCWRIIYNFMLIRFITTVFVFLNQFLAFFYDFVRTDLMNKINSLGFFQNDSVQWCGIV